MNRIFAVILTISWGLWLGGLVALFIFVQKLFGYRRELAVEAAPQLFLVFGRYQVILAALTVLSAILWRIASHNKQGSGRMVGLVIFLLLSLSAVAAVGTSGFVNPRMEEIRVNEGSEKPEFKRLHGISMAMSSAEAILLLLAGALLPFGLREKER